MNGEEKNPLRIVFRIVEKEPLDLLFFYYLGLVREKAKDLSQYEFKTPPFMDKGFIIDSLSRLSKVLVGEKEVKITNNNTLEVTKAEPSFTLVEKKQKDPLTAQGNMLWKSLEKKNVWDIFETVSFEKFNEPDYMRKKITTLLLEKRKKVLLRTRFGLEKTSFEDQSGNTLTFSIIAKNYFQYPLSLQKILLTLHCANCDNTMEFKIKPSLMEKGKSDLLLEYVCQGCQKTHFRLNLPENAFQTESVSQKKNATARKTRKRRGSLSKIREKLSNFYLLRLPAIGTRLKKTVIVVISNLGLFLIAYSIVLFLAIRVLEIYHGNSIGFLLEYHIGLDIILLVASLTLGIIAFFSLKIIINCVKIKSNKKDRGHTNK